VVEEGEEMGGELKYDIAQKKINVKTAVYTHC